MRSACHLHGGPRDKIAVVAVAADVAARIAVVDAESAAARSAVLVVRTAAAAELGDGGMVTVPEWHVDCYCCCCCC